MKRFLKLMVMFFVVFNVLCTPVEASSLRKPVIQKVVVKSYNSLLIKWKKVKNASGYVIYRKNGKAKYKKVATISNKNKCTFIDKKLTTGTKYSYMLKAYRKQGKKKIWSKGSKKISGTPQLSAPIITSINLNVANRPILKWKKVSGATGYIVYRATSRNGTYKKIKTLKGKSTTSYTDDVKGDNDSLYYKVKAYRTVKRKKNYSVFSKAIWNNIIDKNDETQMTKENLEAQIGYLEKFDQLGRSNIPVDGKTEADMVINKVYNEALSGVKDGTINSVTKEDDGVVMRFSTGIWYVYQPKMEGVDASGTEAKVSIMTLQPYQSTYTTREQKESLEATDYAASKIEDKLSNYSFNKNYDNDDVTLNTIKSLSANQVVLCHTHGYYSNDVGSIIWLGEKINWSQLLRDGKYAEDYKAGRVVMSEDYSIGFTSAFVAHYCRNLNNSFIYLGACDSGKDSRLAQSFLNKGARAVIANTETIYRGYNCDMMEDVVDGLLMEDTSTHKYYTLEKALSYAKQENGDNDFEWLPFYEHVPATPVIFGDKNYRLSEKVSVVEATSVKLDKLSLSLNVGDTTSLTATVLPDDATDKTVTWESSNASIAAVNSGTVTGRSAGTAIITAKTSNGKEAKCSVTVTAPTQQPSIPVTRLELFYKGLACDVSDGDEFNMEAGQHMLFQATVFPSNASDKTVTWSSNNSDIASVNNGEVVLKTPGAIATITARTSNGITVSFRINICPRTWEQWITVISNMTSDNIMYIHNIRNFDAYNHDPDNYDTSKYEKLTRATNVWQARLNLYQSDANELDSLATDIIDYMESVVQNDVERNNLYGMSYYVQAMADNLRGDKIAVDNDLNKAKRYYQTAYELSMTEASSVKLDNTDLTLKVGDTEKLTAYVYPINAIDNTVIWSCDNTSVASVSNGIVMGKSIGKADVTAKTSNGKTATCTVTVEDNAPVPVSSIVITCHDEKRCDIRPVVVEIGRDVVYLGTNVKPSNASNKSISWSSSNENVAVVDGNGKIISKTLGTTTITATAENGKKDSCTVKVIAPVEAYLVDKVDGEYKILTRTGNTSYIEVKTSNNTYINYADLYIKAKLGKQLLGGGSIEIAWNYGGGSYATSSRTITEKEIYYDDNGYYYFPIQWAIQYEIGVGKIYYEIRMPDGLVVHPKNWNTDDMFYIYFSLQE